MATASDGKIASHEILGHASEGTVRKTKTYLISIFFLTMS